jgi:hypothetical protein
MPDIDKELAKSIQQAKKTPRNFAIIAKGTNVLHLIVSKKPILEGALAAAKKEFQGNLAIKGIVAGSEAGPELSFHVVELPALADSKLKNFISETAGMNVKPQFQVVPQLHASCLLVGWWTRHARGSCE